MDAVGNGWISVRSVLHRGGPLVGWKTPGVRGAAGRYGADVLDAGERARGCVAPVDTVGWHRRCYVDGVRSAVRWASAAVRSSRRRAYPHIVEIIHRSELCVHAVDERRT